MELKFIETIEGKEWVAEFEAPSDFNLHIEREITGSLVVMQRTTTEGEYALSYSSGKKVTDCDFCALIYPKHIKVVSSCEVSNAVVTFA